MDDGEIFFSRGDLALNHAGIAYIFGDEVRVGVDDGVKALREIARLIKGVFEGLFMGRIVALEDRLVESVFVVEVIEKGGFGDAGFGGDVAGADTVVAVVGEELVGGL